MGASVLFYSGSLGKTIRIDTSTSDEIRRLASLFQALADGTASVERLGDWLDVRMEGLAELMLERRASPTRWEPAVFRMTEGESGPPTFRWCESPDVWRDCVDLVLPVGARGTPGHQYFSEPELDDAVIVIAFGEGRPRG